MLVEKEASVPEAASPREPSIPVPRTKVESEKHHVFAHCPKDRNCEVCRRTKITIFRKRTGNQVPRAENVGDLITADPNVLNEECASRSSHRYAVIVQDLATQWLEAYPRKTGTSQETEGRLRNFLEPKANSKVIYTDNSLEI